MMESNLISVSQPFNLALNLTLGKAFRWRIREEDAGELWYSGVIYGNYIRK